MSLIAQVKARLRIQDLIAPHTELIQYSGASNKDYFNAWCPFCQEGKHRAGQSRSFWVNVRIQKCGCFKPNCCGLLPMDGIDFYSKINNTSLSGAARMLDMWGESTGKGGA